MIRGIFTFFVLIFATSMLFAQSGTLKGKVIDATTKEGIPFANVAIELDGTIITGGQTDFDGNYTIKPIPPGKYTVKASYVGYQTAQVNNVIIKGGVIESLNFSLSVSAIMTKEVVVTDYKVPLIDKDQTKTGNTVTSEEIAKMPGRSAASVVATASGVYSQDGEVGSIRGQRTDGTVYYVDGVKVRGTFALPKSAQEQISVVVGGVSAKYGEATGGVIEITSKPPAREFSYGVDFTTSRLTDPYNYNVAEINVTGPLWLVPDKKDTTKKKAIAGFLAAVEVNSTKDTRPSAFGYWKAKDEVRQSIIKEPLRVANIGEGTWRNTEFLHQDSFEKIKAKENSGIVSINSTLKFDFTPTKNTSFILGNTFYFSNNNIYSHSFSLFNSENNGQQLYRDYKIWGKFTQKFIPATPEEAQKALIKNAYYSIQVDYTNTFVNNRNKQHKDNLFNYGYIGKFKTYKMPRFQYGTDTVLNMSGYLYRGLADTLYAFERAELNPVLADYNDYYYSMFEHNYFGYNSTNHYYDNINNFSFYGGLLNGRSPAGPYGLWSAPGTQYNAYQISNANQFRISASGFSDIKNHEIALGFEFEQRNDKFFSLSPLSLWSLGRELTNYHIRELDYQNPIPVYDIYGVYHDTIYYNRKYSASAQSQFDIRLRQKLGKDPRETEWLDFDTYDPSQLSIKYFSADELINNGNNYVSYYGYDHHGNKLKNNPSFNDFFTATYTDELGNTRYKREVAPYMPNYSAAYIEDKFYFRDLVFRIGLRIDRFDANQMVLKDPYLLVPAYTAGDIRNGNAMKIDPSQIPSSIGDNYVVYVDNKTNPQNIKGFRNGNTWYNANGSVINDPQTIYSSTGIAPYLVTEPKQGQTVPEAFIDYEPQITAMPRIAFSFPISDVASFFSYYEIITKRPTNSVRLDILDYMYINNRSNGILNNPNAKPEKTIRYELGFQQALNKVSSLKMSAFYSEVRDLQQAINVTGAYPINYMTYGNIDFGTIKGLSLQYDLRRTRNVRVNAGYTLQFANGTGSSAETGINLIRSGQPNIRSIMPLDFDQRHAIKIVVDYRYPTGAKYNGPAWGKKYLEGAGVNFNINSGSGSPYSKRSIVGGVLEGQINGSRKPWRNNIDMRIDKDIPVSLKKDAKPVAAMNVYLEVLNVLNIKNVNNVYSTTGNPDDNGYLSAPENQPFINSNIDVESYINYYNMLYYQYYGNYSIPRRIRLGVQLQF